MNHTADIRSVRPGDAPQLAHIQTESWKAAFREIIPADILSEYTDPEPVTRMYEHLLTHGSAMDTFWSWTVRPTVSHGGTPPESPTWPGPPS